ncbi:MAG: sulfur carrier protein [Sphingobacteriales bacterium]|jgi:sulfur carrier protein
MQIQLNGSVAHIKNAQLDIALEELQFTDFSGMAIAINNSVIPREQWNSTHIQENDQLVVITATQGG